MCNVDSISIGARNHPGSASWRIVVGISFVWAFILGVGILTMPESPRYVISFYFYFSDCFVKLRVCCVTSFFHQFLYLTRSTLSRLGNDSPFINEWSAFAHFVVSFSFRSIFLITSISSQYFFSIFSNRILFHSMTNPPRTTDGPHVTTASTPPVEPSLAYAACPSTTR